MQFGVRLPMLRLVAAGVACTVLVGCGSQGAGSDESLVLYTSEPQAKIDEVVSAFSSSHPGIGVEVFRAGTGDLTTRIAAERESGEIGADVLLAADAATFESYASEGLLRQYSPADATSLNPDVIDAEGFYTGTRIIPTVIAYNTEQVDTPPQAWQDLGDAAYADQLIMPNPDVSGAAAYNASVWLNTDSLGEKWLRELAANRPTIADSNGPVAQAVAAGSSSVGIVVDYVVRDLAQEGSPISVAYPREGVPYVSQPVGIFSSTSQAEAAEIFVDFLVSRKGQALSVAQNYLPVRDDVGSPADAPPMADIPTLNPDLSMIQATQNDSIALFNEIMH